MANPKNVIGGFKSGINRKIRLAQEYAQTETKYSVRVEAEIEEMISGIKVQMERWETKLQNDLMGLLKPEEVGSFQEEYENHDDNRADYVELKLHLED